MGTVFSITVSIFVVLAVLAYPIYYGFRIALPFIVKKYLVFVNNPDPDAQIGFFTHALVNANEAVLFVRGSQGEKGGTFIKAAVNSPEYQTRGAIEPNCPVENFDLVKRMKKEEESMGPWEKLVFQRTGFRYKGHNFWDIFFASVYRYRFMYTKEEPGVGKDGNEVMKLIPRNAFSHRFLLEEQTHAFDVKGAETGGIQKGRVSVNLKGHFTFRIVNLYKPTQVAGQYVVKTRDQIVNLARDIIQQRSVDQLLLGAKADEIAKKPDQKNAAGDQKDTVGPAPTDAQKRFFDDFGAQLTQINDRMTGLKLPEGVTDESPEAKKLGTEELWGIKLIRVTVEEIEFPPELLKTLRQRFVATEEAESYMIGTTRRAEADKKARKLIGEGERAYLIEVGAGQAAQRESLGKGDALALKALKEDGRASQESAEALVLNRQKTEAIVGSRAATVVMDTHTPPGLMLSLAEDPKDKKENGKKEVA